MKSKDKKIEKIEVVEKFDDFGNAVMVSEKKFEPPVKVSLKGKSLVSVADLSDDEIRHVLNVTKALKAKDPFSYKDCFKGSTLACLFYEPSTRTSSSFIAAANKMGGNVIPITQGVQYSSVAKGESISDTVRTLSQYVDVIAIRHPDVGSAKIAAKAAELDWVSVINAGDGHGEHPTQALTDLFTIINRVGIPEGKTVTFVGDLKYSRTVHSLLKLLWRYQNVTFNFVSPDAFQLPIELFGPASELAKVKVVHNLADVIGTTDVLYVTRPQAERMTIEEIAIGFDKDCLTVNAKLLERAKKSMIVMHPMPRTTELSTDVDSDPRACYFEQIRNGMFVRMALLCCLTGSEWSLV